MTTALLFERAAPASRDLVFGEGFAAPRVDLSITGAFPALTAKIKFIPPIDLSITGTFPALTASVQIIPGAIVTLTGAFPALQATVVVIPRVDLLVTAAPDHSAAVPHSANQSANRERYQSAAAARAANQYRKCHGVHRSHTAHAG